MIKKYSLPPEEAYNEVLLDNLLKTDSKKLGVKQYRILKRSLDARKRPVVHLQVEYYNKWSEDTWKPRFQEVSDDKRAIIVGSGPAGLFAAIGCLERGIKPLVLERGKDVQSRRRDIADINKRSIVDPHSNYCFGEGGAGTYSDGKLYTRSSKRGDIPKVLQILHYHGARDEILYDAHPHIGTNKLPNIVKAIRETIIQNGGEIRFESFVSDLLIDRGRIIGVTLDNGDRLEGNSVILATGHSARDIFELLDQKNVKLEAKPFALGVRVEHPQALIDKIQYRCGPDRGPWLPASSYSLTANEGTGQDRRGVFSFCMCPGGFIVPASTSPGEVVVNGMSPSRRDSKYANSGIVVSVLAKDLSSYSESGSLAGMYYQREIERAAFGENVGLAAPAQRLTDLLKGHVSSTLNDTSYQPGLYSADFRDILPDELFKALRAGLKVFGKKMKGYISEEGQAIGIESRTSSPVRIPRDPETFEHIELKGLYPAGEGAGYAGGIVSAAMDGLNIASRIPALAS